MFLSSVISEMSLKASVKGKCVSLLGNLGSFSKLPNLRNWQKAARESSSCLLAFSVEVSYQIYLEENA